MDAHGFVPQFARPPFGADDDPLPEHDYQYCERPRAHDFAPQFVRPPFGADDVPMPEHDYQYCDRPRTHYGRNNPIYKKDLCRKFWSSGCCKYGDSCIFAHEFNENEVSMNSFSWQRSGGGDGNMNRNSKAINDMKSGRPICKGFSRGKCQYERCTFLHHRFGLSEENRKTSAISIEPVKAELRLDSIPNRYLKTRLCNKWMGLNTCPYGNGCTYAHGRAELRYNRYGHSSTGSSTMYRNEVFSSNADEQTVPADQQGPPRVCLFKWSNMKKIIGIYADWIDEETLEPSSSCEQ